MKKVRRNAGGTVLTAADKDTNPKDAVGVRKWRQYCCVPMTVIWEVGVAMLEGALKYGRHNFRVSGVRASVYVEAAKGHIDTFWEGQDIDPDSQMHHITKAIASLVVLRDAMIQNKWVDDRPPKTDIGAFSAELGEKVEWLLDKYSDPVPAYLEGDQYKDPEMLKRERTRMQRSKPKKRTARPKREPDLRLEDMHGPGPGSRLPPIKRKVSIKKKTSAHTQLVKLRKIKKAHA